LDRPCFCSKFLTYLTISAATFTTITQGAKLPASTSASGGGGQSSGGADGIEASSDGIDFGDFDWGNSGDAAAPSDAGSDTIDWGGETSATDRGVDDGGIDWGIDLETSGGGEAGGAIDWGIDVAGDGAGDEAVDWGVELGDAAEAAIEIDSEASGSNGVATAVTTRADILAYLDTRTALVDDLLEVRLNDAMVSCSQLCCYVRLRAAPIPFSNF
jgi:hypothetical protein